MYKVKVNDQFEFSIDKNGDALEINGQPVELDQVRTGENSFHILHDQRSYNIEVLKADPVDKILSIRVNGNDYQLAVKDRFDLLLQKLGMNNLAATKVKDIKAPMPGLVLDIKVESGQEVKEGDQVIVLEAMKMENILKAPGDGVVKEVKVKKGDAVDKNTVLIVME